MKMTRLGTVELFAILTARAAQAASPELDYVKQYESLLGGDPAAAQKKLACPEKWQELPGTSPDHKRSYTTLRCVPSENQVYVEAGKVFAIGLRIDSGLPSETASVQHKEVERSLTLAGCKLTDRGQAAVARCAGGKAVAVLNNWDSKSNSNTISMLYGLSAQLLPIMGMSVE
ncbi:MAG: hypothetical protein QM813_18760 [Verrucomicrobiota bacterium]